MCTATWVQGDRFQCFLFNRDEKRTRSIEDPPEIHNPGKCPRYLAPTDPLGGGTWIAVNEYGITAAVLNHYEAITEGELSNTESFTSRGILPPVAVSCKHREDAAEAIARRVSENRFSPFLLILRSADGDGSLLTWNGNRLSRQPLAEVHQPLTTSSWCSTEVTNFRRELFHRMVLPPNQLEKLLEFHATEIPDRPAFGPAMVREDASTRSLTIVRIAPEKVSMRHQSFDPGTKTFGSPTEISLSRRFAR